MVIRLPYIRLWIMPTLLLLAAGLSGCPMIYVAPPPDSPVPTPVPGAMLPFEIVASGYHYKHQPAEVQLFLITDKADISSALSACTPPTLDCDDFFAALLTIDLRTHAALVLVRQVYGGLEYKMDLEHVVLQEDRLVVYVRLINPAPLTGGETVSGGHFLVAQLPWDGPSADAIQTQLVTYTDYQ
ncbi:MAG TPA: hypothetical protein VNK95_13680 [Caldilineaceae bacterium]|nr:hypothetical protein [Caldilineaceae bacterium]